MPFEWVLQIWRDGRLKTERLQPGDAGVLQALGHMTLFAREDARREWVRRFVLENVVQGVPGHDRRGEVAACFSYARDQITYRSDPWGVDRVADFGSQLGVLRPRGGKLEGDCGLKSQFLATSLAAIGYAPRFEVITQRPDDPAFNHVSVALPLDEGLRAEFGTRDELLKLDPTPERARMGFEAHYVRRAIYPIF